MTEKSKQAPANPKACSSCPWRIKNQGTPHPDGWYKPSNLARLWQRLRRGESMSCHKTDPNNPVPKGQTPVPDGTTIHECSGALIVQQREFMNFQLVAKTAPGKTALKVYKQQHPNGMTREGMLVMLERAMFGGTALGGMKMSSLDLGDEGVGYPAKLKFDLKAHLEADRG